MKKIPTKKRILVLGGTGFIGSNLVAKLQQEKRQVTVFTGDINDKKILATAVSQADIIVNLVGSFSEDFYYSLNVLSSANLLSVCKVFSHIKKIIFISSEAVYGDYAGKPYQETDTPKPTTEYAFSKYVAEQMYVFYGQKYHIPVIILRLANTYGPGQRVGVISECINSALKSQPVKIHKTGKQRRDFLYVDDATDAMIKSIDYAVKGVEIFNISGNKTYSLLEMISLTEKIVGKKINIQFFPPKKQDLLHMEESNKKAKKMLGYMPKTDLEQGLTQTINYIKNT